MEKRQTARFHLEAPAKIYLEGQLQEIVPAMTRDISERGAFLKLKNTLVQGSQLEVEVMLSIDKWMQVFEKTRKIRLTVTGLVVRTERSGVAVQFDKKHRFEPVNGSVVGRD